MIKKHFVTAAIACAISTTAPFATAAGQAGTGPSPYTDCGIGAALFKDTHWAAVSSNIIWDLGTTAVTSATMSPETCNAKKMEAAQFILDSYESLVEETAKGQGENISAMLDIFGCQESQQASVIMSVRSDMAKLVSTESYTQESNVTKATAYYNSVSKAVNSCSA
ncbi:Protein of unknown function [Amphritea atlantica]|jgi:hypothetical protein|uniref:DUF3015 domain-containing protein n=1 Tax=Amphritea atlantica TaxID=355243 RepID=A0A1H9GUN2_9GAMM|nr:DUF3015 family protein [Amphritea atlantica]SEQ53787.1 Protein of unknown function [Amphritea atlantica]